MTAADNELGQLLRDLAELHSKIDRLLEQGTVSGDAIESDPALAALASSRIAIRRRRFFSEHLLRDPAWDMLTHLYLAADQEPQPVASLAEAAAVPESNALRWVAALVEEGWAVTARDGADAKRLVVRLSDAGRRSMTLVFSQPKILALCR